jgi:hypothetical protein
MNAQQVNSSFDLIGYVGGITSLHKSGVYWISVSGCPVCGGGKDRFQIKHSASGDTWICRKCHPRYGSALDFLMEYHKETFKEALQRGGGEVQPRRELDNGKPMPKPAPVQVIPSAEWQADAWALVESAASRLTAGDDFGSLYARQYLQDRKISRGSIFRNWLGYVEVYNRPAVVIPYMDLGDIITALKYRFIDDLASENKSKRFAMMTGSMPNLFGLQHIRTSDDTLLFLEGELNQVSILQTEPSKVSIISAGSEGNGNAALLKALAKRYNRVVIWTDDPAKGKAIRERMNRPEARLLKSPVIEGVKYDANQMLQAGLLMDFVSAELSTKCQGVPVDTTIAAYMDATP